DDHAEGLVGARGYVRPDVAHRMIFGGEFAQVLRLQGRLVDERHFRRLGNDEVRFDVELLQGFEHAQAEDDARRAADAHDQALLLLILARFAHFTAPLTSVRPAASSRTVTASASKDAPRWRR